MVERKFERREPRKAKWWKGGGSLSFRPFLSQPSSTSSERTFLDCKQGQVRLTVFKLSNLVPACRRMTEGEKVRFKFAPSSSVVPEEYWVVANIGMAAKWKQDPSIPLTDVLQSFGIFKGHGKAGQAPQADLLKVFGTKDQDAVIRKILAEGEAEQGFEFQQHKNQRSMKKEK